MSGCCPTHPYPTEALPAGWANAKVIFRHRNGQEESRIEIVDLKTKTRYFHEPMRLTALKCFELFVFTGVYLAAYLAFHVVRTFCMALETASRTRSLLSTTAACLEGIWAVVRAPFYALKIEFAALYGIFQPLEGKAAIGQIEQDWHQKSRQSDLGQTVREMPFEVLCLNAFTDAKFPYTFFLASCMQPIGPLSDSHIARYEFF